MSIQGSIPSEFALRSDSRRHWLAAGALAVIVVLAGGLFFRAERERLRALVFRELATHAELKSRQISDWRNERLSDARFLSMAPAVATDVAALLANPDSVAARATVTGWLKTIQGGDRYESVFLLDQESRVRLAITEGDPPTGFPLCIASALKTQEPLLSDLHLGHQEGPVHMDLVAPIFASGSQRGVSETLRTAPERASIAIVVLRLNPGRHLFPLIQAWATPSASAETLLVRRESSEAVYLNELRHRTNSSLRLRRPLEESGVSAAVGAGEAGVREGVDYRGVPVLTAFRPVAGTPWVVGAKIDRREAFALVREEAWHKGALVGLMLLAIFLGTGFTVRARQNQLLHRALHAERERKSLAERLALLTNHANDIIMLANEDQRIVEANERAVTTYGYSLAELCQRTTADLRPPAARARLAEDTALVLARRSAVFETIHQRKDGTTFPVEVSSRRVVIDGRIHFLGIFRDITERKLAESALRASEERHRLMFAASPQPMWVYDLETLAFLEVNEAAIRQYGYTREEFLAMTIKDIRPPEDVSALLALTNGLLAGSSRSGPWRHRRKDGAEILVEIASHGLVINGRQARLVLAIDVTERCKADETLRERENQFQLLFENSLEAVLQTEPGGRVLAANPAACILFGRTEDEIRACGRAGLVDPGDSRLPKLLSERTQTGRALGEMRFLRRDGTAFEAEVAATLYTDRLGNIRSSVSIRDVTARKFADAALRESEERYRSLFEANHAVMLLVDPDAGAIVDANPAACGFYGWTREQLQKMRITDINALPLEQVQAEMVRARATQHYHFQFPHRRADGTIREVEVFSGPISVRSRTLLFSIVHDITDRKAAERALSESEERLRLFVQHAPASLAMFDRDMRYIDASRRWQSDYGLGDRDLRGLFHYEVFPEITNAWKEVHRRGLAGEVVRAEEDQFERADRSVQWLRWEVRPWRDDTGAVGGIVIFTEDITARKKAEAALAEQMEELRRWHAATLGRETRLLELKAEVNQLLAAAGQPIRYRSAESPARGEGGTG